MITELKIKISIKSCIFIRELLRANKTKNQKVVSTKSVTVSLIICLITSNKILTKLYTVITMQFHLYLSNLIYIFCHIVLQLLYN